MGFKKVFFFKKYRYRRFIIGDKLSFIA